MRRYISLGEGCSTAAPGPVWWAALAVFASGRDALVDSVALRSGVGGEVVAERAPPAQARSGLGASRRPSTASQT